MLSFEKRKSKWRQFTVMSGNQTDMQEELIILEFI